MAESDSYFEMCEEISKFLRNEHSELAEYFENGLVTIVDIFTHRKNTRPVRKMDMVISSEMFSAFNRRKRGERRHFLS